MKYTHRLLLERIKRGFKNNRIIIIIGSRQVGKTTIMKMYEDCIAKEFKRFYFNLEDVFNLNNNQADNTQRLSIFF